MRLLNKPYMKGINGSQLRIICFGLFAFVRPICIQLDSSFSASSSLRLQRNKNFEEISNRVDHNIMLFHLQYIQILKDNLNKTIELFSKLKYPKVNNKPSTFIHIHKSFSPICTYCTYNDLTFFIA